MSVNKWTKGPWEAKPHNSLQWYIGAAGSAFDRVAITCHGNDEANAKLMAASPTMAYELEMERDFLSILASAQFSNEEVPKMIMERVGRIDSALKMARGEK